MRNEGKGNRRVYPRSKRERKEVAESLIMNTHKLTR